MYTDKIPNYKLAIFHSKNSFNNMLFETYYILAILIDIFPEGRIQIGYFSELICNLEVFRISGSCVTPWKSLKIKHYGVWIFFRFQVFFQNTEFLSSLIAIVKAIANQTTLRNNKKYEKTSLPQNIENFTEKRKFFNLYSI